MSNYWERRQEEDMYQHMEGAEIAADQISRIYRRASGYLSSRSDDIFEKFRSRYGLSETEARRLLNQVKDKASLDELLRKLEEGAAGSAGKELLKLLEAPAYQARLERLRQIQNQLDQVMRSVYQQEKDFSTSFYTNLASEAYYRSIFNTQQRAEAAFSFAHVSAKVIDSVISSRWSGKNYSERIWNNTEELAATLKEELLLNFITGRSNREAAQVIANKFAQGASNARRLVRTESNYVATEMNFKAYEECKIEKYQYLATLDLRTSEVCRELDGKLFPVKDRKVEKNCPPMHPWCRSTTVSVVNEEWIKDMQRSAVDPATGKRIKVPRSMTYRQWYDTYVKGRPEVEAEEKKIKTRSSDRRQYRNYKEILGDNAPKTLDDFQDMKYNDPDGWEYTKGLKEYLRKYPTSDKCYYDAGEELKRLDIAKGVVLPPVQKQAFILPEGGHDPYHIMYRMAERHMTDDEVRSYMSDADAMLVQWGGKRQAFYGNNGVCVITKSGDDWIYKTAWKKEDFDENTEKVLEVIKKYVK